MLPLPIAFSRNFVDSGFRPCQVTRNFTILLRNPIPLTIKLNKLKVGPVSLDEVDKVDKKPSAKVRVVQSIHCDLTDLPN